jgi:putative tryptophan/tyrosine transport system substrate-binding protein
MAIGIRRRQFISAVGGAAASWPLAARAQQPPMPVIGYLSHSSSEASVSLVESFRKGLSQTGFVEGQNVAIEYRWANFQFDRLPELAEDLVRRHVAVIATPVSTPASLAAKAATTTIPIIFGIGTDPVKAGLVTSFNHPGGNITGVVGLNWELGAKRLGLLHELLPSAAHIAVLINPNTPQSAPFVQELQATADTAGLQLQILAATTNREIDIAFATLAEKQSKAIMVPSDQLFLSRRVQIVGLSLRHDVPVLFPWREAVEIGGLMSYGSSFADLYRQAGIYVGRILKGEKPADLPVVQSTKFEFVLNLQTARTLGIEVPPDVLSIADEVIE